MAQSNLLNLKFGRLTVIRQLKSDKHGSKVWECKCDCGNFKPVLGSVLRKGATKSCGCLQKETIGRLRRKHGYTTPKYLYTYVSWVSAINRCTKPRNASYKSYGGRGIKMCDRWLGEDGFKNFLEDMGFRPKGRTLDRFPNNETGIYEKDNCRWATPMQQSRGKRSNTWIEYMGEKMILQDWANKLGIKANCFTNHLKKGRKANDIIHYYLSNERGTLWRNKK